MQFLRAGNSGFLISAIVGLDTRTTMDLYTTIKGFTLTHKAIRKLWEKCSREYEYSKGIHFDDTCNTIETIMDAIMV